jgi:hypothetical protein
MQVLYRETRWLQFWSQLEMNDQDKEIVTQVCWKLETVALQIYDDQG